MQCGLFRSNTLLARHLCQMFHDIAQLYACEVIDLTAREDSRQHLMALCSGKNKYGMARRLLQRLEEGVESCRRKHMHLVDDEHFVSANLRRYAHLVNQFANIIHRVV